MTDVSHTEGRDVPYAQADLELVLASLEGDTRAREQILMRLDCVGRMLKFKNAQLGSPLAPSELEDVAQETLVVVWRKLGQFRGEGSFEAWVWRIAFLELLSQLRKRRRFPVALESLEPKELEQLSESPPDPLENEHLYRGLNRLGPPDADILRLKHLEGCTFQEIAERLQVSVNTIKARYYRGLVKMRHYLGASESLVRRDP